MSAGLRVYRRLQRSAFLQTLIAPGARADGEAGATHQVGVHGRSSFEYRLSRGSRLLDLIGCLLVAEPRHQAIDENLQPRSNHMSVEDHQRRISWSPSALKGLVGKPRPGTVKIKATNVTKLWAEIRKDYGKI